MGCQTSYQLSHYRFYGMAQSNLMGSPVVHRKFFARSHGTRHTLYAVPWSANIWDVSRTGPWDVKYPLGCPHGMCQASHRLFHWMAHELSSIVWDGPWGKGLSGGDSIGYPMGWYDAPYMLSHSIRPMKCHQAFYRLSHKLCHWWFHAKGFML